MGSRWRNTWDGTFTTRTIFIRPQIIDTEEEIRQLTRAQQEIFKQKKRLKKSWKFEVDGNRETALEEGRKQIAECGTNACVVNGPAYGAGFGLLTGSLRHCGAKEELFEELAAILPKRDR